MSNYKQPAPEGKDPELWEIAQRRGNFKNHLIVYLVVNSFLWAIWLFSAYQNLGSNLNDLKGMRLPWPLWPTLGWGIGLVFQYAGAYIFPKANSVEREYEKLKNQTKK